MNRDEVNKQRMLAATHAAGMLVHYNEVISKAADEIMNRNKTPEVRGSKANAVYVDEYTKIEGKQ